MEQLSHIIENISDTISETLLDRSTKKCDHESNI